MLSSVVKFSDDATGLEKALRLCQYFSQATAGVLASSPEAAAQWTIAHSQFALARRYFRLLKWHPSWTVAYDVYNRDQTALGKLLEFSKWSFLGLYFFLEMFTITNAMRITTYPWGPTIQQEANKCWLYAISFSILLSLYQLASLTFTPTPAADEPLDSTSEAKVDEKGSKVPPPSAVEKSGRPKILVQLAIDCCDIIIPAAGLQWLAVDQVVVGTAGSISTILAGQQVWTRVQADASKK